MNERSVKPFSSDEMEAEDYCPHCRDRLCCGKRCRRELEDFMSRLPVIDALNDLTYDSANRMVGG